MGGDYVKRLRKSGNIQIYTLHFCQGEPQLTEQKNRKNLGFTLTINVIAIISVSNTLSHKTDSVLILIIIFIKKNEKVNVEFRC